MFDQNEIEMWVSDLREYEDPSDREYHEIITGKISVSELDELLAELSPWCEKIDF